MSAPSRGLRDCAPLSCSMAHPPTAAAEMLPAPLAFDGPEFEALETRL